LWLVNVCGVCVLLYNVGVPGVGGDVMVGGMHVMVGGGNVMVGGVDVMVGGAHSRFH